MKKKSIYLQLYLQALYASLMMIGTGYVYFGIIQKKFVEDLGWLEKEEVLDYTAMGQSVPGAIGCNFSVMVGYRVAGVLGALCMYLGAITTPLVFITIITLCYNSFSGNAIVQMFLNGMCAASCAIMLDIIINMSSPIVKKRDWKGLCILGTSFAISCFLHVGIQWIITAVILMAIVVTIIKGGAK